jgi:hypothetical protein
MIGITKNHKITIVLVAIAALAAALVGSTIAIGSGHMAFAHNGNNIKVFKNKGINKRTYTNQKQKCETTGRLFPVTIHGFPGISGQGSGLCTRISAPIPFFILI